MSDQKDVKPNDGTVSEDRIYFRISTADKEKIRDYFGSFSDMRDYVIDLVDNKGDKVKREVNK